MPAHGMMFHHFHDAHHPRGQGSISADQFRAMLHHINPRQILPAKEFLDRANNNSLRPTDICLTFDDNLRCQYDIAVPVLKEFGLTAFFFVYTSVLQGNVEPLEIYRHFRMTQFACVEDFYKEFQRELARSPLSEVIAAALDDFDPKTYLADFSFYTDEDRRFRFLRDEILGPNRYHQIMNAMLAAAGIDPKIIAKDLWMSDDCLRELHNDDHVIGLHSHTHPTRLARFSGDAQHREYAQNFTRLKNLLNEFPTTMSHPCNSYNATTLNILHDLGIRLGFCANMSLSNPGPLELPREDHANILNQLEKAA
jgi:peptidoglycan/xylan/chitin deacetylase (PgdA/CDA1 family)